MLLHKSLERHTLQNYHSDRSSTVFISGLSEAVKTEKKQIYHVNFDLYFLFYLVQEHPEKDFNKNLALPSPIFHQILATKFQNQSSKSLFF